MLDAIRNRRSVRFYKNEPVSDEAIAEVLKAGFCAPSAHGKSPWHVVVVRDQAAKDELSLIHRWSKLIARAPVVLVVCVDDSGFEHFWPEDGSALMENMLTQATDMGLGTCWIGIRGLSNEYTNAEDAVRKACNLPHTFHVLAITPLGVPARHPGPHEPTLPEGRVHYR